MKTHFMGDAAEGLGNLSFGGLGDLLQAIRMAVFLSIDDTCACCHFSYV